MAHFIRGFKLFMFSNCQKQEYNTIIFVVNKNKYYLNRVRKKGDILKSIIVEIEDKGDDNKRIPARLVFVRNKNKASDWLALISTDTNLKPEEIVRIYGKRWNIEVFFKTCNGFLTVD